MRVLFVEPPKDIWFVMGEYLPPPFGIIQLAAYLEREVNDIEISVLDCNAERVDWRHLEKRIHSYDPDIVASSALATCNTYRVVRTLDTVKKMNADILTVTGGQHFTATAQASLETYPIIDVIVRGEGEETFTDLVKHVKARKAFKKIPGISFRGRDRVYHNPCRPLIQDLDSLPYPGYHFVEHLVHRYHFAAMMGRDAPYALIEGSRGCSHRCTFCTQWRHWDGLWRTKSPKRIADEMAYCYQTFGSRFIWLTDDNFGFGDRAKLLAHEVLKHGISRDVLWFTQARCDDVIKYQETLPLLQKSGLQWVLLGIEHSRLSTLQAYRKRIRPDDAMKAVQLLKENSIFAQAMFIIGDRADTAESIAELRNFVNILDPDFVIFAVLTPFPGTTLHDNAKQQGWIKDSNWANYDMIHAIMPTNTLSREEVQEELYHCYRSFYGSWNRRLRGVFASNPLKRRIYWYMIGKGILRQLKALTP